MPDDSASPPTGAGRISTPLALAAILVLAANLRPAVTALGTVLPGLRADTGMPGGLAGVLAALPTLCFAVVGLIAPALAGRIGTHRTVLLALGVSIAGQLLRSLVPGTVALFAGSLLTLAGFAVANILLPGLVRLHFPGAVTAVTAVYTTVLSAGGAVGAAVTLPLQHALGGDWRLGLGQWAALAAVAVVPWIAVVIGVGPPRLPSTRVARVRLRQLARSPVALALTGYFGLQALQMYVMFGWLPGLLVDAGLGEQQAALQVSILGLVGLPMAAVIPALLGRTRRPAVLITAMTVAYLGGYLGLLLSPGSGTWLWSVLIGVGAGAFPAALTLIGLRARSTSGTLALSAFAQSFGYLIASVGPVLFGLLHDWTGGWTWPLLGLCAVVLAHHGCGLLAVRPRFVEDDLTRRSGS